MIDGATYVSAAAHERELARLWPHVWMIAGHSCELQQPGDWFVFEIARESIVVVREDDTRIRAFHNVCQHRGTVLCNAPRGRSTSFRCPYHQWVWALDGALRASPGVPLSERKLAEIRCELRHGFVFVNMDEAAVPLVEFLGHVDARIAAYRPEQLTLVHDQTVAIDCNWKASADVSNESYHLPMLHPELADVVDLEGVTTEPLGVHTAIRVPLGAPRAEHGELAKMARGLLDRAGVPAAAVPRTHGEARAMIRDATRARLSRDGLELPGLDDDGLVDKHQLCLFPNTQLNFTAFGLELYRHRPHPDDPARCLFDEQAYTRLARHAASTARLPERVTFRHGERGLGPVMSKDVDILPLLQRGMRSRGFTSPLLVRGEEAIANLHRALELFMGDRP